MGLDWNRITGEGGVWTEILSSVVVANGDRGGEIYCALYGVIQDPLLLLVSVTGDEMTDWSWEPCASVCCSVHCGPREA